MFDRTYSATHLFWRLGRTSFTSSLLIMLLLFGKTDAQSSGAGEPALPDTARAGQLLKKANELTQSSQFDSAIVYLRKALQVLETPETPGDNPNVVKIKTACYNQLGRNFMRKGKLEEAHHNLLSAIQLATQQLGQNHLLLGESYNTQGIVFDMQGETDKALESLARALQIRIANLGEQHPDVAKTYMIIGIVNWSKGRYDESLRYHRKALSIALKSLGAEDPLIASAYNNIGLVFSGKGEYDKAIEYYHKSLQVRIKTQGEDHPEVGNLCNNLGLAYSNKGDYARALEYYQKDLSILLKTYGEDHPYVAGSYNNIGILYEEQGEYDQALTFYRKSLAIRLKRLGETHPYIAESYNNIGIVYMDKSEYDKAIEYHQKALQIRLDKLEKDHSLIAHSYFNLARAYQGSGDYQESEAYYEKALAFRQTVLGKFHPDLAESHLGYAGLKLQQGQFDDALRHAHQAILSLTPGFIDTNVQANPQTVFSLSDNYLLKALHLKAQAFMSRYANDSRNYKDLQLAHATHRAGADLIDQIRTGYKAEGSKLFLGEQANRFFDAAIYTAIKLFEINHDKQYLESAFQFAERSKSRVLLESIRETQAREYAGIPDSLLELEWNLAADLSYQERKLLEKIGDGALPDDAAILTEQKRIFPLRQRYQQLLQKLEEQFPAYYQLKHQVSSASVKQIQKNILDDHTVLVEYFTGDSLIYIFTITKNELGVQISRSRPGLEKKVKLMRLAIVRSDYATYTKNAQHLYEILIRPIEENISGKNLIIVPHDILAYLPFEALLTGAPPSREKNYSELPYLIKDKSVGYAHSADLLLQTRKRHKERSSGLQSQEPYIAFAPVFTEASGSNLIAANISPDILGGIGRSDVVLRDSRHFQPLAGSEQEVQAISQMFTEKALNPQTFLYMAASEANLKQEDLNRYRYIHFATHAVVNEQAPELSGIILAQDSLSGEDGILFSGELYNLKLNADLVVLSACETGLGKFVEGEGIMGLSRGFFYAGAANLVVSLWQVADLSTSMLITELFRGLIEEQPGTLALQAAKLDLILDQHYSNPYYWSPFILIGY